MGRLAAVLKENPAIVNPSLGAGDAAHYYQAIHDHVDVFGLTMADLREPAHSPPFEIHTFGPPAHKPPIRCSPTHAQYMRDECKLLEQHGLTMRGPTPWASPCFLVPKPRSTKLRTVIDFRQLNMQTRRDSHPIPHTRDVLSKITQFDCYNKLDLMSGFWQLAMEANSVQYTGVITTELLYMWLRLPFGVRNGPPAFQRAITEAIHGHGLAAVVGAFIDDLATGGRGHRHSAANCARMFAMLRGSNFKAGASKVFLGQEELPFLGYLLRKGALSPDPDKVSAIERLLPPKTRSEVRAFLGLTGYYREFVYHYSHIARPLTQLLKEDTAWAWSPPCEAAFTKLKQALTSEPILALPDPHRPYYLSTDYSHVAVGAILE